MGLFLFSVVWASSTASLSWLEEGLGGRGERGVYVVGTGISRAGLVSLGGGWEVASEAGAAGILGTGAGRIWKQYSASWLWTKAGILAV